MAVKKTIELEVDLKGVDKDVRDIREQFTDLSDSIKNVEDSAKKTAKNTAKGFKGLKGAVDRVKKGFSGLGLAIKGLGIGLVLEAFNTFKSVLGQNQVVADAFAVAFGTVSNLFNDFINFVLNNWQKATKPITEFFQSDTFSSINDIFFEIVTRIKNIIQGIGGLGKALVKVFKADFAGAADEAKLAIENFGDAIKGNAEETISVQETVANTLKKVGDVIKENTKDAYENAKAEVALRNAAALAAAEQEKLRIENLKAAEDQRQIRDDVSKSIEERIAANQKLGTILEEGIKQEKELAEVQLAAAEAALANNTTNIELQAEVTRAQAAVLEIEERIGGLRSEQLTNETALLKEKLDLTNAISQSDSEAKLRELEGQLLVEDGILDRLELERQVAAEQQRIAEEQFENTAAIFKKGTIEYENALKEQTAAQETYSNINKSIKKKEEEAKLQIVSEGLNGLQQLLGESSVAGKAVAIAQSIINTYQGATKALAQGGIFGAIGAAGVIASGLATVKKIVATKIPGANDTAGAEGIANTVQPAQAPAFNVVGSSPINQITQALSNQQPVKAYVVSGEVTTAQQLDRNIISESGI
jgi:hypothetical protein